MSRAQRCIGDCLECYMEQILNSFDNFIKKSLILISLALGSVIIMAIYVLKLLSDRTLPNRETVEANRTPVNKTKKVNIPNSLLRKLSKNNSSTCGTSAKSQECNISRSCSDEKILMEIGFTNNSKPCVTCKPSLLKNFRPAIPSAGLPDCESIAHECQPEPCPKDITASASCCSMCCDR